jgi:hypothetical protein
MMRSPDECDREGRFRYLTDMCFGIHPGQVDCLFDDQPAKTVADEDNLAVGLERLLIICRSCRNGKTEPTVSSWFLLWDSAPSRSLAWLLTPFMPAGSQRPTTSAS